MILLIKFYRKYISGLYGHGKCKFTPTCSEYAISAYQKKHGIIKGTLLSIWRILRCNPFGKGGYDPLK